MQKRYLVFALVVFSFFLEQPAAAQWSTDPNLNNAICAATNGQTNPTIVSDGSGGAIITWVDTRGGIDYDIYAQRNSCQIGCGEKASRPSTPSERRWKTRS